MRGVYVAVESCDGGGKGTIVRGFEEYHKNRGEVALNIAKMWLEADDSPTVENNLIYQLYGTTQFVPGYADIKTHTNGGPKTKAIIVSEPTHTGIGKHIREELVTPDGLSKYDPEVRVRAYSADRDFLLHQLVLPALADGVNVYTERNVTSSLVYQGKELGCSLQHIADQNELAMANLPPYTIIAAVDLDKAMDNLRRRVDEQDNCGFETEAFQRETLERYLNPELHAFLERHGSKVLTLDIGKEEGPESTIEKAKHMLEQILSGNPPN